MQFEVRLPHIEDSSRMQVLVVEAKDWFSALRNALKEIGEQNQLRNVLCDLIEDGVYRVTETEGGRIFEIHEMDEEEDELEFAPPESVTMNSPTLGYQDPKEDNLKHTLDVAGNPAGDPLNDPNIDMGATIMDLPPIQDLASMQEASAPAPAPPPQEETESFRKKKKKDLGATMLMDFASIIEHQGKPKTADETVEFRDFATKEELELESPSIIVAEEAFSNAAPAAPATKRRDDAPTIRQAKDAPSTEPATAGTDPGAVDVVSELTGASGQYKPGMTTEMLADVFMRAGEISDFGQDRSAAMKFVLDLALGDVKATGGGVLLTDLNSPDQDLWFEAAAGPGASAFQNFRIPLGQGLIGYYTQQGVNQIIADVQQEERFKDDLMRESGAPIGPMLCAPMSFGDRVWGCVVLFNEPGARPFTQGELSIMTYLAYTSGEYLSNLSG